MTLTDRTLLVTGGTGSFGGALVARALACGAREIRVFSRDEKKQADMRLANPDPRLRFMLGDVRDLRSLQDAFDGVEVVFHAAALKQVPSCELHPLEAVRTNVLGAENVMAAATDRRVGRVIMLSTDKAIYPINAMGLTKALMEKLTVAKARLAAAGSTTFCTTRYGNVMASRGSVIPLFVDQIRAGRPLTVTDPAMTRFMMSLRDSVDLVVYAVAHGRQGDVLVQKAPACTLGDLAAAIQTVFDAPGDLEIVGARPGEKRHESLVGREDAPYAQDLGDYFRIPAERVAPVASAMASGEGLTSQNTRRLDKAEMVALLQGLDYIREARRTLQVAR